MEKKGRRYRYRLVLAGERRSAELLPAFVDCPVDAAAVAGRNRSTVQHSAVCRPVRTRRIVAEVHRVPAMLQKCRKAELASDKNRIHAQATAYPEQCRVIRPK